MSDTKPWQFPYGSGRRPCYFRSSGQWRNATLLHGPWGQWALIEYDGKLLQVPAHALCWDEWTPADFVHPDDAAANKSAIDPDSPAAATIATLIRQECERLTAENARLRKELANASSS